MKRRRFLTIAGVGGAVAAIGSLKVLTLTFEDSAEHLIRKELSFLQLDTEGVKQFVKEYSTDKNRVYKLFVKGFDLIGITSSSSGKVHQLVSTYLLSTDFFTHQMDESRVIRYVALFNPYLRPCSHPFKTLAGQREDGSTVHAHNRDHNTEKTSSMRS